MYYYQFLCKNKLRKYNERYYCDFNCKNLIYDEHNKQMTCKTNCNIIYSAKNQIKHIREKYKNMNKKQNKKKSTSSYKARIEKEYYIAKQNNEHITSYMIYYRLNKDIRYKTISQILARYPNKFPKIGRVRLNRGWCHVY